MPCHVLAPRMKPTLPYRNLPRKAPSAKFGNIQAVYLSSAQQKGRRKSELVCNSKRCSVREEKGRKRFKNR